MKNLDSETETQLCVYGFLNKRHGFLIKKGMVGIKLRKNDAEYIVYELSRLLKE